MKNKITRGSGHGNGQEHVPSKYDANIRKNGFLHFQLGLILSLLLVWGVFQIPFANHSEAILIDVEEYTPDRDYQIGDIEIERNHQQQSSERQQQTQEIPNILDQIEIIDADNPIEEFKGKLVSATEAPSVPGPITLINTDAREGNEQEIFDIAFVKDAPLFPGCDKKMSDKEKKECLNAQIMKFIKKNFNTGIAEEYGLTGVQKIYVQFQIDETGRVAKVQSRAPNKLLEKEAERVINKLPQMTPGRVQNKNVSVRYMVPIIFEVK